jgi:hypothetical protein
MILAAFGIRTTPGAVRNYVNSLSGVYSAGVGTSLDHLGRVLRESGLEVSDLHNGRSYLRWSTDLLREHIQAGHPVMTLVKYRALPGHTGSWSEFDHYIVISGLAGDDFIYNDAAYSGASGYGLLISPRDLERAWDYSSIPRHGMAVSLGSGARIPTEGEPTAELELSEEEQLETAELSLGEEMRFLDSFGGLTFRRVEFDVQTTEVDGPAVQVGGGLELAEFVPLPEEDAARLAAQQAIRPPIARPSLLPFGPESGLYLLGLGGGLLALLVVAGWRRMVD